MGRVYQLMSMQAQFFATSWDSQPSAELPLQFGYSYGMGPFAPEVQTLPLPSVPTPGDLRLNGDWSDANSRRVNLAEKFLAQNDELMSLLYANIPEVQFNHYNLEVYLSIAQICRQNLLMLKGLDQIDRNLETAQQEAAKLHYPAALKALDAALDAAAQIRDKRNQALQDVTLTWYQTWFPRVREANGRHVAEEPQPFVEMATSQDARRRQEGLKYLVDREFLLPFGDWVNQVQAVRNAYANAHKLPTRQDRFDWQDTTTLHRMAVNREL